jgi:hypothetical protein
LNAFFLLYLLIYILVYIILIIVALILLVVVLPLNITFLSTVDRLIYEGLARISVLLGIIQGSVIFNSKGGLFKLRLFWLTVYSWDLVEEEKPVKKPEKARLRRLSPRRLLGPARRLFASIIREIKLRKLDLDLTAGLSDPYMVGWMFGVAYPFVETARVFYPVVSISLNPVFTDEVFRSRLEGRVSLRIIMLVIPLLRFYFSKEFREYRRS